MSTKKLTFHGTEVGIEVEESEGTAPIAYAIMGGLSVSLTQLEDGKVFVNIEPVINGVVEALVVTQGADEMGNLRFEN